MLEATAGSGVTFLPLVAPEPDGVDERLAGAIEIRVANGRTLRCPSDLCSDNLLRLVRLRIAKLQKMAFGKSSEKVEREIEQLERALEDLFVAIAEQDKQPIDEGQDDPESSSLPRSRPRVSDDTVRERRELDPGTCCPECGGDLHTLGEDVSEMLDMECAPGAGPWYL